MKRFITSFFTFVIGIMMLFIIDNKFINAADDIVYYQSIVATNNSSYGALTAVSQKMYKETNLIGTHDSKGNPNYAIANKSNFNNLPLEETCGVILTTGLCTDNKLNPALATLTISATGDVVIELANEVTLTSLRIYYIIAHQSEYADVQLYCDSGKICEHAKRITTSGDSATNWRNSTKSSNMVYGSQTITTDFTKNETDSGKIVYTDFNVIKKMHTDYQRLAEDFGAYVITAMTINYQNKNYYVNHNVIDNGNFSRIGNENNEAVQTLFSCENITEQYGCSTATSYVSNNAALVRTNESSDINANKSYNNLNEYFKSTIVPIAKIVIIIMFIVTGTFTMINIVKASDEPEVRSAQIKRFIWLFMGALVIYLVLEFYEEAISIISGWF